MARTNGAPPSPWESTSRDEPESAAPEPGKVLGELLLGKAGRPTGGIASHEIRVSTGLVLGGVCLGLAGFAALALGQGAAVPQELRELGAMLAGAGLLVLLWGILAGLPPHRTLRVLGLGGLVIGCLGLAAFSWAYPQNWGKPGLTDHTVTVLGTYVAGLVLIVAATFAALVSDFVLRMQARSRLRGELGREPTDDEIQRDIDEALRRHKVTWGGLSEDHGKGIIVKAEALPSDWKIVAPRFGKETVASGERADAVSSAVDALTNFRGGRQRTGEIAEGESAGAADALRALRSAQAVAPKRSWLDRLLGRWPKPPPGYGAPPMQRGSRGPPPGPR